MSGQAARYHGGQALAYGCDPCENIVYNGCHDNETVFDQVSGTLRTDRIGSQLVLLAEMSASHMADRSVICAQEALPRHSSAVANCALSHQLG